MTLLLRRTCLRHLQLRIQAWDLVVRTHLEYYIYIYTIIYIYILYIHIISYYTILCNIIYTCDRTYIWLYITYDCIYIWLYIHMIVYSRMILCRLVCRFLARILERPSIAHAQISMWPWWMMGSSWTCRTLHRQKLGVAIWPQNCVSRSLDCSCSFVWRDYCEWLVAFELLCFESL